MLDELGIELIGASYEAIRAPRTATCSRETMERIGLRVPH